MLMGNPLKATSPAALGWRVAAEWERHEATWLAWPHDSETWPHGLSQLEAMYLEIIEHLQKGETKVRFLTNHSSVYQIHEENGFNINADYEIVEVPFMSVKKRADFIARIYFLN